MDDHKAGNFNWACFKTQQAAEYAVKAILRGYETRRRGIPF
jgi:HEPN domain-containing protein